MNARYTTSAAASDEALTRLREDTARNTDRLTSSEVECRQLTRQLEACRANEARLQQEVESARHQGLQHSQLMHQLQSIQTNLEFREATEGRRAERQIVALEAELSEVKQAGKRREEEAKALHETLQSELVYAQQAVKQAEVELEMVRQSLTEEMEKSSQLAASTLYIFIIELHYH